MHASTGHSVFHESFLSFLSSFWSSFLSSFSSSIPSSFLSSFSAASACRNGRSHYTTTSISNKQWHVLQKLGKCKRGHVDNANIIECQIDSCKTARNHLPCHTAHTISCTKCLRKTLQWLWRRLHGQLHYPEKVVAFDGKLSSTANQKLEDEEKMLKI